MLQKKILWGIVLFICVFILLNMSGTKTCNRIDTFQDIGTIPRIVHQQWWPDDHIPAPYDNLQKQTQAILYNYEYILWNLTSMRDLIKNHYAWFLPTYDAYKDDMYRGDAARYFILYHYGGVYIDVDYVPQVDIYKYLNPYYPTVLESPHWSGENVGTALMASPPNHELWPYVFQALEIHKHEHVLKATGPQFLDKSLLMYPNADKIQLLPCKNFYRYPTGDWNKYVSKSEQVAREIHQYIPLKRHCGKITDECLYGIHYSTVLWVK